MHDLLTQRLGPMVIKRQEWMCSQNRVQRLNLSTLLVRSCKCVYNLLNRVVRETFGDAQTQDACNARIRLAFMGHRTHR